MLEYKKCDNGLQSAIKTIYDEREDYLVLGLTGRTGSGCTTIANFLRDEINSYHLNFNEIEKLNHNEKLKYTIIGKYFDKHKSQLRFKIISMTDIILTYLFDLDCEQIKNVIHFTFCNNYENQRISELQRDLIKYKNDLHTELQKISLLNDEENIISFEYYLKKIKNKNQDELNKNDFKEFNLYFDQYSSKKDELKHKYIGEKLIINDEEVSIYSFFLQKLGNLIRKNRLDINNLDSFSGKNMYCVAERASEIIKVIRKFRYIDNNDIDKKTFICLDAIRNPYEATYFQDRYSNFYLVAISTSEEERRNRLINEGYTKKQIQMLDKIEYSDSLKKVCENNENENKNSDELNKAKQMFYKQNIHSCLQLADIYIYNHDKKYNSEYQTIEQLLIKYITLILHPGLITPSSVERCMQIANDVKMNSGCLSRQVGAVITDENYSVKAVGWNTTPQGQTPCNLRDISGCLFTNNCDDFSKFELENEEFKNKLKVFYNGFNDNESLNGRQCMYCFKDVYNRVDNKNDNNKHNKNNKNQVHTRSLHAEENAFLQLAKYGGEGIIGGNLFTTASPCVLCSKKAIQLGIKKIYYIDPYTDIAFEHILSYKSDKNSLPELILFSGAVGRAYTFLYSQRIPYKDELRALQNNNESI